jgi:hypothetical protein
MTRVRFPSIVARPTLRGIQHFTHADNSNCSRLTIAVPDHFVNRFSMNHTME